MTKHEFYMPFQRKFTLSLNMTLFVHFEPLLGSFPGIYRGIHQKLVKKTNK